MLRDEAVGPRSCQHHPGCLKAPGQLHHSSTFHLTSYWAEVTDSWQILFCNRESTKLRKPPISPRLFQLAATPQYAWGFLWLSLNVSAFPPIVKIMRACGPEVKASPQARVHPPCRLHLRDYMHFEGHKAKNKTTKLIHSSLQNYLFSRHLPLSQAAYPHTVPSI